MTIVVSMSEHQFPVVFISMANWLKNVSMSKDGSMEVASQNCTTRGNDEWEC